MKVAYSTIKSCFSCATYSVLIASFCMSIYSTVRIGRESIKDDCLRELSNLLFNETFDSSVHHFRLLNGRILFNRIIEFAHDCAPIYRDHFDGTNTKRRQLTSSGPSISIDWDEAQNIKPQNIDWGGHISHLDRFHVSPPPPPPPPSHCEFHTTTTNVRCGTYIKSPICACTDWGYELPCRSNHNFLNWVSCGNSPCVLGPYANC